METRENNYKNNESYYNQRQRHLLCDKYNHFFYNVHIIVDIVYIYLHFSKTLFTNNS